MWIGEGPSSAFPGGSHGKESSHNAGDPGLTPGLGRSPGEGNGYPPQYSCLENPMDRRTWGAIVHGVAKSQMRLNDFHFTQFSSVVPQPCPTLQLHGLQHARLPCPSPIPRAYSDSCPSSWWCYPTVSSSVIPFSCLPSLPPSWSFPLSHFFTSGGQSIGVSASASVFPMNTQDWFPLGWTGLISLHPRNSQESSQTPQFSKH